MDGYQLSGRIHQIEQRAAFVDRVIALYQCNHIAICDTCPLRDQCTDLVMREEPPSPLCEVIVEAAKAMGVEVD